MMKRNSVTRPAKALLRAKRAIGSKSAATKLDLWDEAGDFFVNLSKGSTEDSVCAGAFETYKDYLLDTSSRICVPVTLWWERNNPNPAPVSVPSVDSFDLLEAAAPALEASVGRQGRQGDLKWEGSSNVSTSLDTL